MTPEEYQKQHDETMRKLDASIARSRRRIINMSWATLILGVVIVSIEGIFIYQNIKANDPLGAVLSSCIAILWIYLMWSSWGRIQDEKREQAEDDSF